MNIHIVLPVVLVMQMEKKSLFVVSLLYYYCVRGKVISSAADIDTPNVCAYIKYSVCSYVVIITLWLLLLLLLWCFMHLGYVWPEKCASMGQYITIPDRDRIYVECVCCIVWYAQ